jgi:hypothetical protein
MNYVGNQDSLLAYYPTLENDPTNCYDRIEMMTMI